MKKEISFNFNGWPTTVSAKANQRLIDVIRDGVGHKGTKEGCGEGECGACTVLVDGLAVNSCLYPALEAEGKEIVTIEGLSKNNELSVLQRAFVEKGAIQCGFCSPGMIMSAKALLDKNPYPSDREIEEAMLGNLCRCTGYVQIIEAIKQAAENIKNSP